MLMTLDLKNKSILQLIEIANDASDPSGSNSNKLELMKLEAIEPNILNIVSTNLHVTSELTLSDGVEVRQAGSICVYRTGLISILKGAQNQVVKLKLIDTRLDVSKSGCTYKLGTSSPEWFSDIQTNTETRVSVLSGVLRFLLQSVLFIAGTQDNKGYEHLYTEAVSIERTDEVCSCVIGKPGIAFTQITDPTYMEIPEMLIPAPSAIALFKLLNKLEYRMKDVINLGFVGNQIQFLLNNLTITINTSANKFPLWKGLLKQLPDAERSIEVDPQQFKRIMEDCSRIGGKYTELAINKNIMKAFEQNGVNEADSSMEVDNPKNISQTLYVKSQTILNWINNLLTGNEGASMIQIYIPIETGRPILLLYSGNNVGTIGYVVSQIRQQ